MTKAQPITQGTWNKIASKTYRHESGIVVRYSHNRWAWEIIGGAEDGNLYGTLSIAQYTATR